MIKLFEDYNQYYEEISREEFLLINSSLHFKLDDKEKSLIGKYGKIEEIPLSTLYFDPVGKKLARGVCYLVSDTYIHKLTDEWFTTNYNKRYFKCDQFDGLEVFLHDHLPNRFLNLLKSRGIR